MNSQMRDIGTLLVVVAVVVLVGLTAAVLQSVVWLGDESEESARPQESLLLQEQTETPTDVWGDIYDPYPLSGPTATVTPTPTLTPTPLANGLLPPPEGVLTRTLTYAESEYSSELILLRNALESRDEHQVSSLFADGARVSNWGQHVPVDESSLVPVFRQLFLNGSSPQIQGYFDFGGIYLVTTGWQGQAALPAWPTELAPPSRKPPSEVAGAVFVWKVRKDEAAQPEVESWLATTHYHEYVKFRYDALVRLFEEDDHLRAEYGPAVYNVLLP